MVTITVVLACLLAVPDQDRTSRKNRRGGFLGLTFRELTAKEKSTLNVRGGLKLTGVLKESQAQKVGFRVGDVLIEISGKSIRNGDRFLRRLWMRKGGKTSITVLRDGKRKIIPAGLRELDALPRVGDKAPAFKLKTTDGKKEVSLSSLLSKKQPVFLVFGSWT